MNIRLELLALLDDDGIRVAVSWPNVTRHPEHSGILEQVPGAAVWYDREEWSAKSGVTPLRLSNIARVLFGNRMISADGTIAHEVIAYAKGVVAQRAKGRKR